MKRALYPKDWSEIRRRILERAQNRCERCGAPNHAFGVWRGERFQVYDEGQAEVAAAVDGEKVIRIVLTIAHVDNPDPSDCRDENLSALCQRCHNRLDAPMRASHAAETRRRRAQERGQAVLLEVL